MVTIHDSNQTFTNELGEPKKLNETRFSLFKILKGNIKDGKFNENADGKDHMIFYNFIADKFFASPKNNTKIFNSWAQLPSSIKKNFEKEILTKNTIEEMLEATKKLQDEKKEDEQVKIFLLKIFNDLEVKNTPHNNNYRRMKDKYRTEPKNLVFSPSEQFMKSFEYGVFTNYGGDKLSQTGGDASSEILSLLHLLDYRNKVNNNFVNNVLPTLRGGMGDQSESASSAATTLQNEVRKDIVDDKSDATGIGLKIGDDMTKKDVILLWSSQDKITKDVTKILRLVEPMSISVQKRIDREKFNFVAFLKALANLKKIKNKFEELEEILSFKDFSSFDNIIVNIIDNFPEAFDLATNIFESIMLVDKTTGYRILSILNTTGGLSETILTNMATIVQDGQIQNLLNELILLKRREKRENSANKPKNEKKSDAEKSDQDLKEENLVTRGGSIDLTEIKTSAENLVKKIKNNMIQGFTNINDAITDAPDELKFGLLIILIALIFGSILYKFRRSNKSSIKKDNYNDINFKLLNFITNTETDIVIYNRLIKYADNTTNEQLASYLRKLSSYVAKAKGMDYIIRKNPEILISKDNITKKINDKLNKYMEKKQKKHEIIKNNMMKFVLFVN